MVATLSLALALTTLALNPQTQTQNPGQETNKSTVPSQLNDLSFMQGTWEGKGTGMSSEGKTVQIDGSSNVSTQLDRWIQWDTTDNIPGFGMMSGRMMLTYNTITNMWEGTWFDNRTSYAAKFNGSFANNTLSMTSDPMPNANGAGSSQYMMTVTKTSDTEFTMKLETTMNGANATLIDYTYSKR